MTSDVKVNVEYCGACGHLKQFLGLARLIKETVPTAEISGAPGRQASFEVKVNEELVYSKLQTLAFPDFQEVTNVVKDTSEGKPIVKVKGQQAIDCTIL